jgi:hypothetical protein
MRTFGAWLLLAACLAAVPRAATAGVSFSIGVGTTIGPCHPYHGWYSHRPWHRPPHFYHPWHRYHCRPWCAPGVGVWICPRPVVVHVPAVVTQEHVVAEHERSACASASSRQPSYLMPKPQYSRSVMLKMLRIGDPVARARAARDMAAFRSDATVRRALERALLSDPDVAVRLATAESLDKLGDKRALPTLRQARANDSSREVRQAAYKAIIMLEGY